MTMLSPALEAACSVFDSAVALPGGVQAQWDKVFARVQSALGESFATQWLQKIVPDSIENNQVSLLVPSPCIRELVEKNFASHILTYWREENPEIQSLDFKLGKAKPAVVPSSVAIATAKPAELSLSRPVTPLIKTKRTLLDDCPFQCRLDPTHTFETFVVGKPNKFAYEAARQVAENEDAVFNPLYLHAAVGLGKTHLMHAIAWKIREKFPEKSVLYLSAEQFFQHFVRSVRERGDDSFQSTLRSADVLMVDDIQFIVGKQRTAEEFFHTFNALISQGKKIILSGNANPADLHGIEDRLKTRIAQGLVVNIQPTSYELRLGILQEKVKTLAVHVPADIIDFLAHNVTASVRELEGALKRLVAHAQLIGTPINIDTTKMVLRDVLQETEKLFQICEIQAATAAYFGITLADIKSTRRDRKIARPRQLAMYLAKQLTPLSLPDIGIQFGRDHTTIMHAIRTIEGQLARDPQMVQDKNNLMTLLKEGNNGAQFF